MPYKDNSSDWLFFAGSDLQTAKSVLQGGINHMVCFHSQQAIEKSLKAILRHVNQPLPKTHSLAKLLAKTKEAVPSLQLPEEEIYFVDQFYSPTRYPDTFPGSLPEGLPNRADAEKSLKTAENIYQTAISATKS